MAAVEDPKSDSSKHPATGMHERRSRGTGRRALRGALAATALGWAAVGLVLALMSVLPTPNLHLLWANLGLSFLAVLAQEQSLLLAAFAVLGIALALLAAYTEGDPQLPPSCEVPDTGVAAVVAFYPLTDQTRFDEVQWPWWKPDLMSWIEDPTEGIPENVLERERRLGSPISHVDPEDPPTFLAHGGWDQFVPPEQSVLLANRLEEAGVAHHLVALPWARHGFDAAWGSWNQQIVRHELEEFLEHRLADPGAR